VTRRIYSKPGQHPPVKHPLFIWIPKTGGTSVYNVLSKKDKEFRKHKFSKHREKIEKGTHGHDYVKAIYTDEELENFYKFTVVRNPYTRLVSLYNFFRKYARNRGHLYKKHLGSFSQFVDCVISGEPEVSARKSYSKKGKHPYYVTPTSPQNVWIEGISGVKVYNTENLNELFQDFDVAPRKDNVSPYDMKYKTYKHYYDQKILFKVTEFYRFDFLKFGYRSWLNVNESYDDSPSREIEW